MSYRAKLTLFRSGLFACFLWALFTATHFHLPSSAVAIWQHNPTTAERAASSLASAQKQDACVKATRKNPKLEFPISCLSDSGPSVRMPREEAWANVERFLAATALLLLGVTAVTWLGARMAREPRTNPISRD